MVKKISFSVDEKQFIQLNVTDNLFSGRLLGINGICNNTEQKQSNEVPHFEFV